GSLGAGCLPVVPGGWWYAIDQQCPALGAIPVVRRARRDRASPARGCGVRETARLLGRCPSTISRELRRNAATRSGRLDYRASAPLKPPTTRCPATGKAI